MNLNGLDFNILKHLLYILEEKNISNAAKKASITQPAMSKSLKKIRDILKDEIIINNGSGYSLTEKASHLKPKVEHLLKELENIFNPCEPFDPNKEQATIKIVSSDYGHLFYLPYILEKIRNYPNIKLEVYSPQEQDLNKLQDEDVDFYLGIGKMSLLPDNLIVKKIFNESLLSAVAINHPLASKDITLTDFVSHPHMLISNLNLNTGNFNLSYSKGVIDLELDKLGLSRDVRLVVPSFSSATFLLDNSQYILSAPSKLINYYAKIIDLKVFNPPIAENPQSEFYLAWHPLNIQKRSNLWFKNFIIDKIEV